MTGEIQPVVAHVTDGGIPLWTIILGIIGLLTNMVIGLITWTINNKLGDLKDDINGLARADEHLLEDLLKLERSHTERMTALERAHTERMSVLERELASHKLEAARSYTTLEEHKHTSGVLFKKLDQMKDDIVDHVNELCRHVNTRIDTKADRAVCTALNGKNSCHTGDTP